MGKTIQFSKAKDLLAKNMVEANKESSEKGKDPLKMFADASKDLKEGQSLPYRRDTVILDVDMLNEMVINLIRWSSLFNRVDDSKLKDEYQYIKVLNGVLYAYLSAYDKKIIKPKEGDFVQLGLLKKYLTIFKKHAVESDQFMDMDYQPHIFLRTFAGKLSEAALSISLKLRNESEVLALSKGYFPRCEKLAPRDFSRDAERKLTYVENKTNELANIKLGEKVKNGK